MNRTTLFALLSLLLLMMSILALALQVPLASPPSPREFSSNMDAIVENVFEMELMSKGSRPVNYEAIYANAEKMLVIIRQMRERDQAGDFFPFLATLENETRQLRNLAKKKDNEALGYIDRIHKACFECHGTHRQKQKF